VEKRVITEIFEPKITTKNAREGYSSQAILRQDSDIP